jgi:hypothetical protein
MCRWGWLDSRLDLEAAARQIYRTDVLVGDDVLPWQAASLPPLQQDGLMTK